MASEATRAAFESSLDQYQARLANIKAADVQDYARKIAEAENPIDELKETIGTITTPLALDFLKDGIMHRLGVKGGKSEGKNLKQQLTEEFSNRLDELRGNVEGQVRGRIDEAGNRVRQVVEDARGQGQAALDDVRARATNAVQDARNAANAVRDQVDDVNEGIRGRVQDLGQQAARPEADEEVRGFEEQDEDEPEEEDFGFDDDDDEPEPAAPAPAAAEAEEFEGFGRAAARTQPIETDNIVDATSRAELRDATNRIQSRFNNLDGRAQARSDAAFRGDEEYKAEPQTLDDLKTNALVREETVRAEEDNPDTTFRDPNFQLNEGETGLRVTNPDDIFNPRLQTQRNPERFDNPPEEPTRVAPEPAAPTIPAADEEFEGFGDAAEDTGGAVAQRVAALEAQGAQLRPTQQLPTPAAQPRTVAQEQQAPRAARPEEEPRGFGEEEDVGREVGGQVEREAEGGIGRDILGAGGEALGEAGNIAQLARGGLTGRNIGRVARQEAEQRAPDVAEKLFGAAEGAAEGGAETDGLGFLAAGVLGIIGGIASIFSPHHKDLKPPPNYGDATAEVAQPTQAVGIR